MSSFRIFVGQKAYNIFNIADVDEETRTRTIDNEDMARSSRILSVLPKDFKRYEIQYRFCKNSCS